MPSSPTLPLPFAPDPVVDATGEDGRLAAVFLAPYALGEHSVPRVVLTVSAAETGVLRLRQEQMTEACRIWVRSASVNSGIAAG